MIGHYLLSLTPEQETRVLTQPFERVMFTKRDDQKFAPAGCRCLVLTATDGADFLGDHGRPLKYAPGFRYEDLAARFGEARVNAAIRNRILANQARRMLAGVTVGVRVPHHETQTSKGDS